MSRLLKAALTAAGLATLMSLPVGAQERSARLLQIDFQAFDADGALLRELRADEIELRIDGRVRPVRFVRRIAAAPQAVRTATGSLDLPYGTSADSASGRTFMFIIDEDSFRAGRERPFRNGVTGLLNHLGPSDYVTVIGMPYGGVKVPLTNDHTKARHAIETASGHRSVDETGSEMACRTRLLLESLESVLLSMGGRRTPATVILLTAGLAAPRRDAPMALAPGMCELQVETFRRVGRAAGVARANFYIAQPDDLGRAPGAAGETIAGGGNRGSDNPLIGIEDLSGVTKAIRIPLTALGTGALDRIASETSAYFVAEVEPELQDFDPRSRRLEIRTTRPGVTLRVRPEISFVRPRTIDGAARVTVSDMLTSVATFPDLPLRAAAYTMGAGPTLAEVQVALVAEPFDPAAKLASIGAVLVNDDGKIWRWSAVDAGESPIIGAMRVPPGRYRLRVAAVDEAGRGGAADYRFEAALTQVGSLALGDLILGLSREQRMIPRLEFGDEPSVLASFEIYGGVEGQAVTALLEIAATANGPALVSVPLAIRAEGAGRFLAIGTVPLGALTPGDYAVRGMLQLENGPSGRTIRTLRKVR